MKLETFFHFILKIGGAEKHFSFWREISISYVSLMKSMR